MAFPADVMAPVPGKYHLCGSSVGMASLRHRAKLMILKHPNSRIFFGVCVDGSSIKIDRSVLFCFSAQGFLFRQSESP